MKYNNTTINVTALTTVTPYWPLKTGFDEKLLTHEELQDALITTGKKIQMRIRNDRNKYGNNMEEPDN